MQTICTSLQSDNYDTSSVIFLQAGCSSCRSTNSVKALKALSLKAQYAVLKPLLNLEPYLYYSTGRGQPREPALCQLYRHTLVPCVCRYGVVLGSWLQCCTSHLYDQSTICLPGFDLCHPFSHPVCTKVSK